jgi:hypothetical protein
MFSMLSVRFNGFVTQRIKNVPLTNITKDVLSTGGGILGGCYGFSNALYNNNGVLWRPSVGFMVGYSIGFLCGLFPYHTFGVVLAADAAHTSYQNYKKFKDEGIDGINSIPKIPKEL